MKKVYLFCLALICGNLQMVATEGALSGRFTINANGDQVVFSQGNLQYQASTWTWRFAEHQYDFVGGYVPGNAPYNGSVHGNVFVDDVKCNNALISADYNGWIDLFGGGTGTNPTNSSDENSDYSSSFTDWGINAISNGGNIANIWRTLTMSEWQYMLNTRPNANSLRGQATACNIQGYVILPDGWETPNDLIFTPNPNNWETNTYNDVQWAQMEQAGAVFLPAAGLRNKYYSSYVVIDSAPEVGYYWSNTQYKSVSAFAFVFTGSSITTGGITSYYSLFVGLSVRLVQIPSNDPTPLNNIQLGETQSHKFINGGHFIIEHNGKIFDSFGRYLRKKSLPY